MRHANKEGISLVWTVLMLPVFVGFVGLAIDVGYAVWVAQQLQVAADAAALSSAAYLNQTEEFARSAAQLVAERNAAAGDPVQIDPDADVEFGAFDRATRTFQPAAFGSGNAVRVIARRTDDSPSGPLALLFGPAFGVGTINLQREAVALRSGGQGGDGLAVLHSDQPGAFTVTGNSTLTVAGGGIHVNSSHDEGAVLGNASTINLTEPVVEGGWTGDAPALSITGGTRILGNGANLPLIHYGAPPMPDPLGFLEFSEHVDGLRAMMDGPGLSYDGKTAVISPGYYPDGIRVNSSKTNLSLLPGIYVVSGNGLDINGGTFYADGVMLFITGDNARVSLRGNTQVHLTPYQSEGSPFNGISIFRDYQKPGDAALPDSTINGNSSFVIDGTLYFPNAHLELSGSNVTVGNRIIVRTIGIGGNSNITINRQGMGYDPQMGSIFLVS